MIAYENECIYLTFAGKRHTPVAGKTAGTLTTRSNEMGVVLRVSVQDQQ